jgi:VIT1/CCC1 family predicted Fe2+/Mn2+ transporter
MIIKRFSFGGAAAIVTSVALIIGLDAATATKPTIIGGLLIVAIADNLTDSLSIHIYQESERLEGHEAFVATLTNFAARLLVSLSFVLLVVLLPMHDAVPVSLGWGLLLLCGLTYLLARERRVSVVAEISKHIAVALVVIVASKAIGTWILTTMA